MQLCIARCACFVDEPSVVNNPPPNKALPSTTSTSQHQKITSPSDQLTQTQPSTQQKQNTNTTTTMRLLKMSLATLAVIAPAISAGPAAYGVCQGGCAKVVKACYAAAGFIWGSAFDGPVPATVQACNGAFGICQGACWTALLMPVP
ncbi:unnamed protein product [Zymoseptoria tritici ST99CH_1E4]|uniref:Uncharacterized protein n=1 Tax=Zymoseptoria tritici ST99CH_1E4 TaxID=1276532 RepID=A0A2H1FJ72_ZYMTR|nr:unnamed protein product [Zymoseptoria tritici ST99CH_1E4]